MPCVEFSLCTLFAPRRARHEKKCMSTCTEMEKGGYLSTSTKQSCVRVCRVVGVSSSRVVARTRLSALRAARRRCPRSGAAQFSFNSHVEPPDGIGTATPTGHSGIGSL